MKTIQGLIPVLVAVCLVAGGADARKRGSRSTQSYSAMSTCTRYSGNRYRTSSTTSAADAKKTVTTISTTSSASKSKKKSGGARSKSSSSSSSSRSVQSGYKSKKGSSEWKRTERLKESIRKLSNYTILDMVFQYGDPKVVITGPSDIVADILIEQNGDAVSFHHPEGKSISCPNGGAGEIRVTLPEVSALSTYGTGDLRAADLDVLQFQLGSYGTGEVNVGNVDATRMTVTAAGTGDVVVGSADCSSLQVMLQGTGDIRVNSVDTSSSEIMLNGTGNILVNALSGTVVKVYNNGTGDITVSGDCTSLSLYCTGTGNIYAGEMDAVRTTKMDEGPGTIYR